MRRPPPRSTLFPYTTLFRSGRRGLLGDQPHLAVVEQQGMARLQRRQDLRMRSEEHTSELQSPCNLVCRLLLEKKKNQQKNNNSCIISKLYEMYKSDR